MIARGFETADKNLKEMKASTVEPAKVKEEPVHKVFVWQEADCSYCSYCNWGEWCDMPSLWHRWPQSDYMQVPGSCLP